MKHFSIFLFSLSMLVFLSACSDQPSEGTSSSLPVSSQEEQDILIAYFTWADNTHVDDPDAIDPDATTSASVLAPGNAAKLAGWIQEETGGDLFSIQLEEPYPSDYDACLERAAQEKAEDARPALRTYVEDMADYEVIFLGFPNWWYTVPMPVLSFVEEYDLSDKIIIPFVTHGTGGLSETITDLTQALPESAQVREPIGVYRPQVDAAQPAIQEWLASSGY